MNKCPSLRLETQQRRKPHLTLERLLCIDVASWQLVYLRAAPSHAAHRTCSQPWNRSNCQIFVNIVPSVALWNNGIPRFHIAVVTTFTVPTRMKPRGECVQRLGCYRQCSSRPAGDYNSSQAADVPRFKLGRVIWPKLEKYSHHGTEFLGLLERPAQSPLQFFRALDASSRGPPCLTTSSLPKTPLTSANAPTASGPTPLTRLARARLA